MSFESYPLLFIQASSPVKDLFEQILHDADLIAHQDPQLHPQITQPLKDDDTSVASKSSKSSNPVKTVFCTCSKSNCYKNYCPCFKAKQKCGSECNCIGCHNKVFIPRRNNFPCHPLVLLYNFVYQSYIFESLVEQNSENSEICMTVGGLNQNLDIKIAQRVSKE